MARDCVTLREEPAGDEALWNETSVSRIRLKEAIGRIIRSGDACTITGFALTDGTPLRTVEIRIDGGPWQPATLSPDNTPPAGKTTGSSCVSSVCEFVGSPRQGAPRASRF